MSGFLPTTVRFLWRVWVQNPQENAVFDLRNVQTFFLEKISARGESSSSESWKDAKNDPFFGNRERGICLIRIPPNNRNFLVCSGIFSSVLEFFLVCLEHPIRILHCTETLVFPIGLHLHFLSFPIISYPLRIACLGKMQSTTFRPLSQPERGGIQKCGFSYYGSFLTTPWGPKSLGNCCFWWDSAPYFFFRKHRGARRMLLVWIPKRS